MNCKGVFHYHWKIDYFNYYSIKNLQIIFSVLNFHWMMSTCCHGWQVKNPSKKYTGMIVKHRLKLQAQDAQIVCIHGIRGIILMSYLISHINCLPDSRKCDILADSILLMKRDMIHTGGVLAITTLFYHFLRSSGEAMTITLPWILRHGMLLTFYIWYRK